MLFSVSENNLASCTRKFVSRFALVYILGIERSLSICMRKWAHRCKHLFLLLQCQLLLIEWEYMQTRHTTLTAARHLHGGCVCEQKHHVRTCIGSWFRLSGPQSVCEHAGEDVSEFTEVHHQTAVRASQRINLWLQKYICSDAVCPKWIK